MVGDDKVDQFVDDGCLADGGGFGKQGRGEAEAAFGRAGGPLARHALDNRDDVGKTEGHRNAIHLEGERVARAPVTLDTLDWQIKRLQLGHVALQAAQRYLEFIGQSRKEKHLTRIQLVVKADQAPDLFIVFAWQNYFANSSKDLIASSIIKACFLPYQLGCGTTITLTGLPVTSAFPKEAEPLVVKSAGLSNM